MLRNNKFSVSSPLLLLSSLRFQSTTETTTTTSLPLKNKGILKSKTETSDLQKMMQQNAKLQQKVPVRSVVIPLSERFNKGGGMAKPEVDSVVKAHPVDFDITRGGTQLRIKWRLSKVGGFSKEENEQIDARSPEKQQPTQQKSEQEHQEEKNSSTVVVEKAPIEYRTSMTVISAELMRVCAPSTDVLSLPENVVVTGKRGITFEDMHLVGNYAIRVSFSDGHTAGIYGYQYLYDLSGPEKWIRSRHYLSTLKKSRRSRDPPKKKSTTSV
jgi:DUF971 family protein